ncbi:MAG: biotin carboxylase, partial [Bacteroidota bacterium]
TLGFCKFVMGHEAFRSGNFDTHFVKTHFTPDMLREDWTEAEAMLAGIVADIALNGEKKIADRAHPRGQTSAWRMNRR